MSIVEQKKVEWRWQSKKKLSPGDTYYIYYDIVLLNFFIYGCVALILSLYLVWYIDLPFFKSLTSYNLTYNPLQHVGYWLAIFINQIEFPFFGKFLTSQSNHYLRLVNILIENNLLYLLTMRMAFAFTVGVIVGCYGSWTHIRNPIKSEVKAHRRGFKVLTGKEAHAGFYMDSLPELNKKGAFVNFSFDSAYPITRVLTHTVGVGSTGTGKSQFLRPHIVGAIERGIKTVILDVKYEFTSTLYDPEDSSMAILDYTDKRTHVWDWCKDIRSISEIRRFANAFIPPGEGDKAMWSNSARLQFIGYYLYLLKTKKNFTPRDLVDLIVNSTIKESYYIFEKYYPPAKDTLGQMKDGVIEENVTSYGIKANLKGYIDGLVDLGTYITDDKYKKISLKEFMVNPDYHIKTIFIKPNDIERLMSSGLIKSSLNYMISLLDSSLIKDTNELRGIFFLDEFQAPGALLTEEGTPTIDKLIDRGRSKGFGAYLFVQDMLQLENTYSESIVNQWFVVAGTKVLCGTPPGKTAEWFSNMVGKVEIDKEHKNMDYKDGKPVIGNISYQTHLDEVLLPSEISSYLRPTVDGNIRFLMLGVGLKNAYIFENPIVPLEQRVEHWLENPQAGSVVNRDTGVFEQLKKEMNNLEEVPEGEDYLEPDTTGFGVIDESKEKRKITVNSFNNLQEEDLIFVIERSLIFNDNKRFLPRHFDIPTCNEIARIFKDTSIVPTEELLTTFRSRLSNEPRMFPIYKFLKDRRERYLENMKQ